MSNWRVAKRLFQHDWAMKQWGNSMRINVKWRKCMGVCGDGLVFTMWHDGLWTDLGVVFVLWGHQHSSSQTKRQVRNYWERNRKHSSLCNTKSLVCQMLVLVLGSLFPEEIIGLEKAWWKSSKRLIKAWNSSREWSDWMGWRKKMTEGR